MQEEVAKLDEVEDGGVCGENVTDGQCGMEWFHVKCKGVSQMNYNMTAM